MRTSLSVLLMVSLLGLSQHAVVEHSGLFHGKNEAPAVIEHHHHGHSHGDTSHSHHSDTDDSQPNDPNHAADHDHDLPCLRNNATSFGPTVSLTGACAWSLDAHGEHSARLAAIAPGAHFRSTPPYSRSIALLL